MKKRFLIPLIILGMGAVGTAAGFSVNAYYQNKANETAQLIEVQENIQGDENLTEEEKSKLQIVIDQLQAKYNEIKDIQVAGTTIGAIAGSIVGALVGMIPALINRSNIKEALGYVTFARKLTETNEEILKTVQDKFEITDKNYNKVIEVNHQLGEELKKTEERLEKVEAQNVELAIENAEIKDILLTIALNNKDLIASGTAEQLAKKYLKK